MKRIGLVGFALLAAAQLLSSCKKDYLAETPQSLYTPQTVLVDSLGFEAAMAGLQSVVREQYTRSDEQGLLSMMQLGTDVAIPGQVQGAEIPYYNYTLLNSQDQAAAVMWSWAYRTINNCNQIIQGAATAPATLRQGYKDRISGEARFYRAYAYNFLVTLWGDVPLIETPVTTPRTDFTRTPIAAVNTFIINDLTTAIPKLFLASKAASGRITKGAAQQLLGEVYLRTNQPALAETQLKEVISGGQYSLIKARYGVKSTQPGDCFSDMFIVGNQRRSQGNTELIWGIEQQLLVPGGTTSAQQRRVWVPAYYNVNGMTLVDSLGGRGLGRLRLSNWVDYRLYNTGPDMRNSKYNLKRVFYYNNPAVPLKYGKRVTGLTGSDTIFYITPYTTKWNQFDPTDTFGFGTIKDLPMMRLGETYLLLAEAQVKQGNTTGAASSINELRTRAQAAPVSAGQMTLDFILDERARELIGEEQRRLTLLRTGTLIDRVTRLNPAPVSGLTAKKLLLPIPQTSIDLNGMATLGQNDGY
ncbi:RagB/SusD family nutrient uptake outer membrane protein [Hymenobacter negativus]|uniref:RagB/SusD family nutrient uptake outer membrane protein n=1 Tax=Hymenobacter negativus TaxID=2795026 RepID=A0ABS0Q6A8_9BACT|nr:MULTISPECIES: RagB/SusD family nutrient uptake outer membrane protein [Bacteria]MBH8558115.1 RagB/SusD family nutrient uptake outer membrane protein [Hymenobacter negativus]MBH8568606.1 RagB/SusD family nutrient uptake outer membrane protein [Hymenobacter negativus]MBR7208340.1 RagB/SusD family nutrient uptake outer membrane protein [Microvirga sp. STS02]